MFSPRAVQNVSFYHIFLNYSTRAYLPFCHFSFPGVESEALLLRMDLEGIAVSGGSACTSGSTEPSHVLQAIGLKDEMTAGSIRLSLGRETTEEEIEETSRILQKIVKDLRKMRAL